MLRLTFRQILAHRLRLALTLLAVVLGVTFVTGSLVLTDTSQELFDEQFRTATAGADLTVRSAAEFDSGMGVEVERDPLAASVVDEVRSTTGVATAVPVVKGSGLLVVDGTAVVPSGASLLSSWTAEPIGAFTLRSGTAPAGDREVAIDAATASASDVAIGDAVTVRGRTSAELEVVGIVGFGDGDGLPNSTVALTSLETAQELLDLGTSVLEILVVTETDAASTALGQSLGSSVEVVSSADIAASSADAAKDNLQYLQVMLLALAGAALLIGAFLIVNTFSIVVTQRTRELAVLRAAGATGGQVTRSVLTEALFVGIVASVAGVLVGIVAALGLREMVGVFGVPLPDGDITVTARTVLISLAVGIGVTLASAVAPARRAASVSPIVAMRENTAGGPAIGVARRVAGFALAAVAGGSLAAVFAGAGVLFLAVGAVAGVVGITLLGPVVVPVLLRAVGRPLRAAGVPGALARESAARDPRRTATTVMALALGLTLILFITIVSASVKSSISSTYEEVISADYVIESSRSEMLGGLPPEVHHHVSELPEVAVASRLQYGHWRDGEVTKALTAIDPSTIGDVASVDMVEGSLDAIAGGGIIVAAAVADELGVGMGDALPMTFSKDGLTELEIVGLVDDADARALSTDYLVSLESYASLYSETMDASVFVRTASGVSAEAAAAAIDEALAEYPTVDVRDQAAAVDGRTSAVDQILGLVTVLLLLALVIALLGITNTLALSVLERTREIGLLRAVGMSRRQLVLMVQGEAVLVATVAIVLGVGLGMLFGASAVVALGGNVPLTLEVPVERVLLLVALTGAAGLLAGLLPSRRASRLRVLDAIAHE